jgi:DNA-binding Xre family transcriptional regulator
VQQLRHRCSSLLVELLLLLWLSWQCGMSMGAYVLLLPQVEELRDAGADEFNRRLSIEATLRQAAALFKRELATKSDEVAGLQSQLRAMRHELTSSNACGAAAVAAAGAARHAAAAAAGGSCAASPCGSPGSAYCTAAGVTSPAAAAFGASYGGSSSYSAAAGTMGGAAASPGAAAADVDGSAAAAVAAELQALSSSRASYQNALLQQQAMRNSLLSSLGDCMEVSTVHLASMQRLCDPVHCSYGWQNNGGLMVKIKASPLLTGGLLH